MLYSPHRPVHSTHRRAEHTRGKGRPSRGLAKAAAQLSQLRTQRPHMAQASRGRLRGGDDREYAKRETVRGEHVPLIPGPRNVLGQSVTISRPFRASTLPPWPSRTTSRPGDATNRHISTKRQRTCQSGEGETSQRRHGELSRHTGGGAVPAWLDCCSADVHRLCFRGGPKPRPCCAWCGVATMIPLFVPSTWFQGRPACPVLFANSRADVAPRVQANPRGVAG